MLGRQKLLVNFGFFIPQLFDFDTEVAPILENIVTRALEQGLSEVLEEEELIDIQVRNRKR